MQPQHGGTLQDRQVAKAPQSALFDPGAARLASGTHDGVLSAFEMQRKLCGTKHLIDDAKFWETEQRFETMEIHEHRSLLLGVFFWRGLSRILRGILRLSISGSQPLVIDLRHWPQIWRRACHCLLIDTYKRERSILFEPSSCSLTLSTALTRL
jgi:hypothetical protein